MIGEWKTGERFRCTCFSGRDESGRAGQSTADGADGHHVELVLGEGTEVLHRVVVGLESGDLRVILTDGQFRFVLDDELDGLAGRSVVMPADVYRSGRYLRDPHVRRRVWQFCAGTEKNDGRRHGDQTFHQRNRPPPIHSEW